MCLSKLTTLHTHYMPFCLNFQRNAFIPYLLHTVQFIIENSLQGASNENEARDFEEDTSPEELDFDEDFVSEYEGKGNYSIHS